MWWALLLGVIIGALAVVAFVLISARSIGPMPEYADTVPPCPDPSWCKTANFGGHADSDGDEYAVRPAATKPRTWSRRCATKFHEPRPPNE